MMTADQPKEKRNAGETITSSLLMD